MSSLSSRARWHGRKMICGLSCCMYQCQWCLSLRDRETEIETGDGQMSRRRERGSLGRFLERISKHSWMTFFATLGWFRIQSTKCWQVCNWWWYAIGCVLCLLTWRHQQRVASNCFSKLWLWGRNRPDSANVYRPFGEHLGNSKNSSRES